MCVYCTRAGAAITQALKNGLKGLTGCSDPRVAAAYCTKAEAKVICCKTCGGSDTATATTTASSASSLASASTSGLVLAATLVAAAAV